MLSPNTFGNSLSVTVTVNEHVVVETLFDASLAVSVTVVTPLLNVTPTLAAPSVRPTGFPIGLPEKLALHVNGPAQLSDNVGAGIG